MRTLRISFIAIVGMVVLAIALQSFLKLVPERKLHGKIKAEEEITLNATSILRGNLAKVAERYISKNVGFRSYMIPLDAQAGFSIFNEVKNPKITLGVDNNLFEQAYLDRRNGFSVSTHEHLEEQVREMSILRDTLKENGMHFLFIISPSKASIYPEYIMQKHVYSNPQQTSYDLIIPLLKKYEIPYIDGRKILLELKAQEPGNKLYAKGGSHWNLYSSYVVFNKIVDYLEQSMGIKMHKNKLMYWSQELKPWQNDGDLANLTNIPIKEALQDSKYYYPSAEKGTKTNGVRPRILLIGSSFSQQIIDHMFNFQSSSRYMWFEHYKSRYYSGVGYNISKKELRGNMAAEKFLPLFSALSPEVVIMENNEASLDRIGFGFMADAMKIMDR